MECTPKDKYANNPQAICQVLLILGAFMRLPGYFQTLENKGRTDWKSMSLLFDGFLDFLASQLSPTLQESITFRLAWFAA